MAIHHWYPPQIALNISCDTSEHIHSNAPYCHYFSLYIPQYNVFVCRPFSYQFWVIARESCDKTMSTWHIRRHETLFKPCPAELFWGNIKVISCFFFISQHCDDAGCWNLSLCKTKTYKCDVINCVADVAPCDTKPSPSDIVIPVSVP